MNIYKYTLHCHNFRYNHFYIYQNASPFPIDSHRRLALTQIFGRINDDESSCHWRETRIYSEMLTVVFDWNSSSLIPSAYQARSRSCMYICIYISVCMRAWWSAGFGPREFAMPYAMQSENESDARDVYRWMGKRKLDEAHLSPKHAYVYIWEREQ